MSEFLKEITTIALAIIGVAIVSVLVSKQANTSEVVTSTGDAFTRSLATAMSGVTNG
jgi:hypothetical protein